MALIRERHDRLEDRFEVFGCEGRGEFAGGTREVLVRGTYGEKFDRGGGRGKKGKLAKLPVSYKSSSGSFNSRWRASMMRYSLWRAEFAVLKQCFPREVLLSEPLICKVQLT